MTRKKRARTHVSIMTNNCVEYLRHILSSNFPNQFCFKQTGGRSHFIFFVSAMHFKSYLVILLLKIVSLFLLQVCRFLRSEEKIASTLEKERKNEARSEYPCSVSMFFFLE